MSSLYYMDKGKVGGLSWKCSVTCSNKDTWQVLKTGAKDDIKQKGNM